MRDLIDRQAVVDELETWDWQDVYLPAHFKDLLDDIPSAEPEREGKWIEDGYYELPCVCSYCGTEGKREWNYCPNCGARMNNVDG